MSGYPFRALSLPAPYSLLPVDVPNTVLSRVLKGLATNWYNTACLLLLGKKVRRATMAYEKCTSPDKITMSRSRIASNSMSSCQVASKAGQLLISPHREHSYQGFCS